MVFKKLSTYCPYIQASESVCLPKQVLNQVTGYGDRWIFQVTFDKLKVLAILLVEIMQQEGLTWK